MVTVTEPAPDAEDRPNADELETAGPHVAGPNRGQIWVSEDFDAPLPDEFWLGQEQK